MFFGHAVLVQAVTFVLRPTATYRAVELDVPTHWLGALAASFAIVPLVLAVPSGHAADRFGERRVMVVGSLLVLLSSAAFVLLADSVGGIVLASVVLGLGHLCSVVGQQAMVANGTPRERYDTAFGHYTFATSVGQAVGPGLIVLFGGEATIPRTSDIFLWATGLTVVLVVLSLLLPRTRGHAGTVDGAGGSVRDLLRKPGLVRALTVSCVVLAAVDITLVYLPALGAERGIAAGTVGLLLTLRATASMTSRLFLGRLVAWMGRRRLLLGSLALSATSLALTRRADAAVAARGRGRARRPRPRRRPAADHVLARRDHTARHARPRHVAAPDRQPARTGARAERSGPARGRRRRERRPRPHRGRPGLGRGRRPPAPHRPLTMSATSHPLSKEHRR